LQSAFIRTDAYIIDAALQPRARTTVGVLAAVVTIGAGLALTRAWGLPGLCVSIIAGRAVQSVAYPLLAHKHLGRAPLLDHLAGLRFVIVGAALLGGSLVLGQRILAPTWIVFGGGVMASGAAIGALALLVGPSAARRRAVVGRIASLLPGRRGA
jgi:hypothetical protein